MGYHAHEIIPNLWVGDFFASQDENFFKEFNVKFVVNATTHIPFGDFYKRRKVDAIRFPILDSFDPVYQEFMRKHKNTIAEAIRGALQKGEVVLVHCHAGMQRSATLVAVFLMRYHNMSKQKAIKFIKSKRSVCFEPKPTFNAVF